MNWDPPKPAGGRQVPDPTMTEHGICPGPSICYCIFIQVSNRGRNGCIKSWFCQYISIPMKYTVSGSTLQYKVGLTLSFLSLISRGVGAIRKGYRYTTILYRTIIEVIQFWIPPTPREIRLKKLNVSPNLYCKVLSLIVYFVGKLMY